MDTPNESPRRGTDGGFDKSSILAEVDSYSPKDNAPAPILQPGAGVDVELLPFRRVRAAIDAEVTEAVRAHNLAVAAWNAAECDSSKSLQRTLEHGRWRFTLGTTPRTRGIHAFRLPDGLCVYLKTRNWHPFPGGWSCARRVLARVAVVHAEVRVPRMAGDHE